MSKVIFNYMNTEYLITYKGEGIQDAQWFKDQLQYCVDTHDFVTLNNKITGGLAWGYIKKIDKPTPSMPEIDNYEDSIL